jgi:REP element-mobilizing transposase RayT
MSRKYSFRDQRKLYFVTFTVINWLDVFVRKDYRDIFLDSVRFCQHNKGLEVYAYCIMSSHVHMIIGQDFGVKLQDIVRDLKKYTSSKIIEAIKDNPQESRRELLMYLFERAGQHNSNNTRYQFWQQHNRPVELSTNEMMDQRLSYIHSNPVEAGIVLSPHEYLYSSAVNYAGLPDKLIEVMYIE